MSLFNVLLGKRKDGQIDYLQKEPNLHDLKQIVDQINSNVPVISYRYKDDTLNIINEQSALYHIVHTTSKMEKLAAACSSTEGIMLDIGANIGLFSYYYKKRNPRAKTYLFEADKKLIPIIEKNLHGFKDYEIVNSAVSDKSGYVDFFCNPQSSQTNSTEPEALFPFMKKEDIVSSKVPSVTLSEFCAERNIASIDTLKIDIQGGEFKVLKASENILTFTKEAFVEICFLMPETISLIKLMDHHFNKHQAINEIIMGADLKFYN